MARFIFRAAAALELRRRQDDEAQRALAAAETRRVLAARALAAARERLAGTLADAAEIEHLPGDVTARVWHRNWIVGLRLQVDRCAHTHAQHEHLVTQAALEAREAHRKREALERLLDRARRAWQDAERRAEQKVIDELASTRFLRARAGGQP
jgi:flagellar export protein FliJ